LIVVIGVQSSKLSWKGEDRKRAQLAERTDHRKYTNGTVSASSTLTRFR